MPGLLLQQQCGGPPVRCSFVAVIAALIVTVLAMVILCAVLEITVMWYYAVGAVVLGLFVGVWF